MDYLELEEKDEVFEYGSTGELFYIILEGVVEIQIPNLQKIQEFNDAGYRIDDVVANIDSNDRIQKEIISQIQIRESNNAKLSSIDQYDRYLENLKERLDQLKQEKLRLEIQLSELRHLKFVQLMVPFIHLSKCKTFGELAL